RNVHLGAVTCVHDRNRDRLRAGIGRHHMSVESDVDLGAGGGTAEYGGGEKDGLEDRVLNVGLEVHRSSCFCGRWASLTMQNCRPRPRCHSPPEQLAAPADQLAEPHRTAPKNWILIIGYWLLIIPFWACPSFVGPGQCSKSSAAKSAASGLSTYVPHATPVRAGSTHLAPIDRK